MNLSEKEFLIQTIEEIESLDLEKRVEPTINQVLSFQLHSISKTRANIPKCSFCRKGLREYHVARVANQSIFCCDRCIVRKISSLNSVPITGRFQCSSCNKTPTSSSALSRKINYTCSNARNRHIIICDKCTTGEFCVSEIESQISTIEQRLDLRLKHIEWIEKEEIEKKIIPENNIVKSYIDAGLAEPFAIAIVKNEDNESEILDLWEADWWKQYPADDVLICAVLEGDITESEGKWLNSIRSDHMRLAMASVKGQVSIEWARALLDAGFINYPEAVNDVLNGGKPSLIARIRKLDVEQKVLPMQLEEKVSQNFSNTEQKNKD